jgi:uncharacterized protein (DUF305 family)
MLKRTILIGAAAVVALIVSAGCSNSDSGNQHSAGHNTSASATAAPTTGAPSGEQHNTADVWFLKHMIPHHQQAIEMSDIVLAKQGIDPRVTDLANKIKAAQGPEIQQMQDWLKQWGDPPMPTTAPGDTNMPGHGDSEVMPGMMTERELTALKEAQGVDASRMFLTQMIAHHEGAIAMAQTEIESGQFPPAVAMARQIATGQQQEIDTMKQILTSL